MYKLVATELTVLYPDPGTAVVEVLGEHDLATAEETAELFARLVRDHNLLVVDLSETQFIDSSFLNNLKNCRS
jgi:anti-anti-sigma regulatory factor